MKNKWNQFALTLAVFGVLATALSTAHTKAQKVEIQSKDQKTEFPSKPHNDELLCTNHKDSNRLETQCEIKEQTLLSTGVPISVDGLENGGISVKGWDRNVILVRSRIKTGAPSIADARDLLDRIKIETSAMKILAQGPQSTKTAEWNVSYEIFVPRQSDLSLKTLNGGINITDVRGEIQFNALNGGATLKGTAGNVRGVVENGGLYVSLGGDRWIGEGMDVETRNGGVIIYLPENYSAHLVTGTKNGPLDFRASIDAVGHTQNNKILSADLGSGGATVRIMSRNGGVVVRRP